MDFTRKSILTGVVRTRTLDVSAEQLAAWEGGMIIQDAMPHLSQSDREFIMTGTTDEEWDEAFGEDD